MLPRSICPRRGRAALTPAGSGSELDALYNKLASEASHSAPGAQLSLRLRHSLERLNPSERAALVGRMRAGSAPLFIAAVRGNAEVVEYLIHVCCAELEQRGMFPDITRTDRVTHRVTPLWAAAVAGKLHVVRVLADAGADLNAVSDSGSTPVRSACFMNHIEVVRYLISRGVDINIPNRSGGTCLVNAVQSPRLVGLLLAAGADVNATDNKNKTALQYAAQAQCCETVRLLLAAGADPHVRSTAGDDALMLAALKGADSVMWLLESRAEYSIQRRADAMEVLGATRLEEFNDPSACLAVWRDATVLRYALCRRAPPGLAADVPKPIHPKTGNEWSCGERALGMREWSTLPELEERVARSAVQGVGVEWRVDWMLGQALLVRARVLSPTHKDTVFRVMYRGAAYADLFEYERCLVLWTAALSACSAHCLTIAIAQRRRRERDQPRVTPLPPPRCAPPPGFHNTTTHNVWCGAFAPAPAPDPSEALLAASALTRLMLDARAGRMEHARHLPAHGHVIQVAALLTECMEAFDASISSSAPSPHCHTHVETQDHAMRCLAHLIYLMVETADTGSHWRGVLLHCRHVIQAGYRSALTGDTLLHLCVSRVTALRVTYFTSDVRVPAVFPCVRTVRALLDAGADPSARNAQRSTPLHVAAIPANYSDTIVEMLVDAGAHMDTPNRHGDTPAMLAGLVGRGRERGAPRSLQCLAASALGAAQIDADSIDRLPRHLHRFIDLHHP